MEIKDIMEQEISEIKRLRLLVEKLAERKREYEREHPVEIPCSPSFGIPGIKEMVCEKYNMIIEWLTEDMTEMQLHDLYENNNYLDFWEDFKRKARYSQEQFIRELNGENLNLLFKNLKNSDILVSAYNRAEEEIDEFKKQMDEAPVDDGGPCVYDPHSFRNKEKNNDSR